MRALECASGITCPHHGKAGPVRTFGIIAAIFAGIWGVIWALSIPTPGKTCIADFTYNACYPGGHSITGPVTLASSGAIALAGLLVAPRRRQP
jgi:hypothetical protein